MFFFLRIFLLTLSCVCDCYEQKLRESVLVLKLCFRICYQEGSGKPEGLELNGTHQLLIYVNDVNALGERICSRNKNTDTLLFATKQIGLEVNSEKNIRSYIVSDRRRVSPRKDT